MARRTPSLTHEIVHVTPEIARQWLATNTHNRNIRASIVAAYARDMGNGDWMLNGEPIKFAADGTLLDGQHRLSAIVKAETSIDLLVVRGVAVEAQDTMDSGITRKFADQLHLAGEAEAQSLSAILRKILLWEVGYRMRGGGLKVTHAELADTLKRHPVARDCAAYGRRRATAANLHVSTIGFIFWLLRSIDFEQAAWFIDRVCDGVGLHAGHPALILRERIRRERDTNNGRADVDVVLALAIYAWNAYRDGRSIEKLQLPKGGLNNDSFPQPK